MASSEGGRQAHHEEVLLERLTFFSDAVFAIAMTLLVIEVRVPEIESWSDRELGFKLLALFPHYIGFISSFLVIGRFWVGHHHLFGLLRATDSRLVWVNLFFLLTVAFMPFPTAVLSEYVRLRVGVCFYTAWLTLLGLANVAVTRAALGRRELVRPDLSDAAIAARKRRAYIPVAIGALAFAAGLVTPLLTLVALAVGSPVIGRWLGRGAA